MQTEVQTALATGVAEGQKAFTSAIAESGDELRTTVLGLAKAVGEAADAVEHASGGFVRSVDSAARSAETLSGVTGKASVLVDSLDSVSERFRSVTAPIVQASESMNDAMSKIQEAIRAGRAADVQALDQMKKLTEQMEDTHQAAEKAWNDYHRRFAEVDKALAVAAERMASTLGDSLSQFSTFATKTDTALADAVGKLSGALSPIEDYAESLSEYVDLQRSGSTRAAE
jgi:ABC-type transporter Mla subunit MlaD